MKLFGKLLTALSILAALLVLSIGSAQAATTSTDNSASSVSKQISASGSSEAAAATKLTQKQMSEMRAVSPQVVNCVSPSFGPNYFHIICSGDQWWTPWVYCSDGLWYAVNTFLGTWEVWTFCPPGLAALAGSVTF